MERMIYMLLFLFTSLQSSACMPSENRVKNEIQRDTLANKKAMKLKITSGDKVVTAILYDNPTTRGFIAQLPLTVDMEDFAGKEKIFYPPKKLSTTERKAVSDPKIGDINVYAPWGNIAIFYGSYSGSRDLVRIGRITEDIDRFNVTGTIKNIYFELEEQ